MIGNFYPLVVMAAVMAAATSPVAVRSTSVATEIQNDMEWWVAQN